jgi:hypothetical protein
VTLALGAFAASAAPAAAAPDFRGDFESGDLSAFRHIGEKQGGPWCESCGTPPQVQSDVVAQGSHAAKWVLRPGDRRSQLVARTARSPMGSDRYYAASIRFGRDWDWSDQEHETPKNFTILFNLRSNFAMGSALAVVPRSDGHLYLTPHAALNGKVPERDLGPIPHDTWMRFVFRVRLSKGGDGLIEVWRDGRKVVSASGRTWGGGGNPSFEWRIGPYYGPRFTSNRTLWMDDSRVGDSFADVR